MNDAPDRDLDAQLRAAFAPPAFAAEALLPPHHRRWPWLAAAALLLASLWLLLPRPRLGPEGHDGEALGALWVASYEDALARGFAGSSCCLPAPDLAAACQALCGRRLEFVHGGEAALLGSYCGLPTGGCLALLAEARGARACVYVVPRRQDPRVELPRGSRLQLARRELGELVLYVLSAEAPARLLDRFVLPAD